MPNNKPLPQVRIETYLYDKLVKRAQRNRRSITQELAVALTHYFECPTLEETK